MARCVLTTLAILCWLIAPGRVLSADVAAPGWEIQKSGVSNNFRAVVAVSRDVCWTSGSGAAFLRTHDGGRSWVVGAIPCPFKLEYRSLHAWDDRSAIFLSADSRARIYKTSDGGLTWKITYSRNNPEIFFDSVAFLDEKKGFAFSDPVGGQHFILVTLDGGETWKQLNPRIFPTPAKGEAAFAASGTMMATYGDKHVWFGSGGKKARVYRSKNGGNTWFRSECPLIQGEGTQGIFSIDFFDELNGVIVGGDYKNITDARNNAAYTVDGGKTWLFPEKNLPSGFRECVAYVPGYEGKFLIAVGPSGCDYSSDGGKSWSRFSDLGFHALSFTSSEAAGWAVGAEGIIARFVPDGNKTANKH